jgi:hypothetical protein
MNRTPRDVIERLETARSLPPGSEERFNGYGVMGLPFTSGHILAMRRFPASSVGPGYTSVWHRAPNGEWVFYANVAPRQSCIRFFGATASGAIETEIDALWPEPFRLRVTIPSVPLDWEVNLASTPATKLMSAAGHFVPDAAWRCPAVLAAMAKVAGPLLRAGRVGLHGRVPNGQDFVANPRLLWAVVDSRAVLSGQDLGPPGPVHPQARLGDFWIPQRGILAIGQSYFEPFDPARHSSSTCRPADPGPA